MRDPWIHVGRFWTCGEPFLAVDAALRHTWHGFSGDDFDKLIELGPLATSIPSGAGRAALVGADGEVSDEGWVGVFTAAGGLVAAVQAEGPDYPDVLAMALRYPDDADEDGDTAKVSSGEIAIFSTAMDGAGPYSMPLLPAQPGPVPPVPGRPPPQGGAGILLPTVHTGYQVKIRRYTELGDGNCFARWLLIPARASG